METVSGKSNIEFSSHRNSPNPYSYQLLKTSTCDRPAQAIPNPNLPFSNRNLKSINVSPKTLKAEQTMLSLAKNVQIRKPETEDVRSKEVANFMSKQLVSDNIDSRTCVQPKYDFKRFSFGATDDSLQNQTSERQEVSQLIKIIEDIRNENESLKAQVTTLTDTVQIMGKEQSRFREMLIDKNAEIELLRSQISRQSSLKTSKINSERHVYEPLPMQQSDSVSPSPVNRVGPNYLRPLNNITNQSVLTTQVNDITPSKGDNLRSFLRRITSEENSPTTPRAVSVTRYVIKDGKRELIPESRTLSPTFPFRDFQTPNSERH